MTKHRWHTLPTWKKRLNGFFSYLLAAITALINPDATDEVMFKVLTEQFKDAP